MLGCGGGFVLIQVSASETSLVASATKAITFTVQPKPSCPINLWNMIGWMMPPRLLPLAAIPVAVERFVLKNCGSTATASTKSWPEPISTHIACARISCQY